MCAISSELSQPLYTYTSAYCAYRNQQTKFRTKEIRAILTLISRVLIKLINKTDAILVCLKIAQAAGGCNKCLLSIRSYQPHHKQIHKCHKEGETQFWTHLQKLFPSVHCAYRNPQTKFGATTFIYKRDWGIIFEGMSKNCVSHSLWHLCICLWWVDNSELIIKICCNPQSPVKDGGQETLGLWMRKWLQSHLYLKVSAPNTVCWFL